MTSGTQYLDQAARQRFPALGFRRSRGLFRLPLASGISGAIGLNTGLVRKGAVTVQAFISVTHQAIESEIAARGGSTRANGPTITAHLLEAGPKDDIAFLLADGPDGAAEVMEIIATQLLEGGIPWMQRMASIEELADGLQKFRAGEPEFRLPIALRETGRPDRAIESIDRTLELWAREPSTGTVGRFRTFAASLRPDLVSLLGSGDIAGR